MRFALLAVSAVALAALTVLPLGGAAPQPLQARALEDLLETIRRIIRDGDEALGLPVLDPFTLAFTNGSIFKDDAYDAKGELRDVEVKGLADFAAEGGAALGVGQITVSVAASIPRLRAAADYAFDGVFRLNGADTHLYGDGPLRLDLDDLNINVNAILRLGLTGIQLRSLDVELGLTDIQVSVQGLLWGGLLDPFISAVASELALELLQEQRPALEAAVEAALRPPIEDALDAFTWQDLLCLLLGMCTVGARPTV